MSADFIPRPPSDEEVSAISATLSMPRLDSAALRERLACAAALLGALPSPPTVASLIHDTGGDEPPATIPVGDEVVVGRQVEGAGCIPDCGELSRRHFRVLRRPAYFVIEDLQSRNGTFIDGVEEPVDKRVLRDGDFVLAGGRAFLFVNPEAG